MGNRHKGIGMNKPKKKRVEPPPAAADATKQADGTAAEQRPRKAPRKSSQPARAPEPSQMAPPSPPASGANLAPAEPTPEPTPVPAWPSAQNPELSAQAMFSPFTARMAKQLEAAGDQHDVVQAAREIFLEACRCNPPAC